LAIRYLLVLPTTTTQQEATRAERLWSRLVTDELSARADVTVGLHDDVGSAILEAASESDLVVLGLNKPDPKRRVFGPLTTCVAREINTALMVIGQRG
jgi:glucose-6-phosphate-specific signal transduction histidine kinase